MPTGSRRSLGLVVILGLWLVGFGVNQAQAVFYNFDFEQAVNLSGPPGFGSVADALPGWSAFIGTNVAQGISYDLVTAGTANIALIDVQGGFVPHGNFAVVLQSGNWGAPSPSPETPVAIAQTGQIPFSAQSLTFDGAGPLAPASSLSVLTVTFNGRIIPFYESGAGSYAGDISAFAGQTGELRFTLQPPQNFLALDDIAFSTIPVPEPGTCALLLSGIILLGLHRRVRCLSSSVRR